jgi:hypothetical protein
MQRRLINTPSHRVFSLINILNPPRRGYNCLVATPRLALTYSHYGNSQSHV